MHGHMNVKCSEEQVPRVNSISLVTSTFPSTYAHAVAKRAKQS